MATAVYCARTARTNHAGDAKSCRERVRAQRELHEPVIASRERRECTND
jgi:hypothetical protein